MNEFELSPNSRFSVLDNPNALPGKCALCGSSGGDGRKFVDFGFQLDVYGAVYFCTFCVTELAEAIKFVSFDRYLEMIMAYNELGETYNNLLIEAKDMENATRTLVRNCNCEPSIAGEPVNPIDVETDPEAERTNSDSDESGGVEGFDSLHGTPGEEFSSSNGNDDSDESDGRSIDGPSARKKVRRNGS